MVIIRRGLFRAKDPLQLTLLALKAERLDKVVQLGKAVELGQVVSHLTHVQPRIGARDVLDRQIGIQVHAPGLLQKLLQVREAVQASARARADGAGQSIAEADESSHEKQPHRAHRFTVLDIFAAGFVPRRADCVGGRAALIPDSPATRPSERLCTRPLHRYTYVPTPRASVLECLSLDSSVFGKRQNLT